MARGATRTRSRELPPPLPPAERTIGQLVGEALRAYGNHFWISLAIGVPVAVVVLVLVGTGEWRFAIAVPALVFLFPASYVLACAVVTGERLRSRAALVAYGTGVLVFIPVPFLLAVFLFPAVVWLSFVGLSVPAAFTEGLAVPAAVVRGFRLARADIVHVLGGLAALILVVLLTQAALSFVLREFADNTRTAAAILAWVVVSPVVFLGAALLYADQEARLRSPGDRRKERKRHAEVSDALDADREGRPDAARESRPPA
jgi:hypothetical protein